MRSEIAQFLNGERANRGLSQLPVDAALQQSAQAWAERDETAACQTDCHDPNANAEILAWGGPDSKTGAIVVAWMQSDVHRNLAMYSRATAFGVGFSCAQNGTVVASVQFTGVRNPIPATDAAPIVTTANQGAPCVGTPGPPPKAQTTATTAAPTTAAPAEAAPAPATTAAPHKTPPPTAPRSAPPATTTPAVAPTPVLVAAAVPATTSAPPTTTTTSDIRVGMTAGSPKITAVDAPYADGALTTTNEAAPKAESAWIAIVVVVVFLSVLRVGMQLRDRSKESHSSLGL